MPVIAIGPVSAAQFRFRGALSMFDETDLNGDPARLYELLILARGQLQEALLDAERALKSPDPIRMRDVLGRLDAASAAFNVARRQSGIGFSISGGDEEILRRTANARPRLMAQSVALSHAEGSRSRDSV